MKKRLLIPIYIILFSLLIGCINQSSSTKAPKFSAAELQQAEQIRNNLFTPGSVTIRGTIKGYNSKLGVKTYQLYYCNYFDDIHNSKTLDIDSLGHFEISFDVPFTIGGCIVDSRDKWHNFIAQAGDTLLAEFSLLGNCTFSLSDGRPYLLEHIDQVSRSGLKFDNSMFRYDESHNITQVVEYARQCKEQCREILNNNARKYHYTAFEYQYESLMDDMELITCLLSYRNQVRDMADQHYLRFGASDMDRYHQLDSISKAYLTDTTFYSLMREFPYNDTLMLAMPYKWALFNRYKYDPVYYRDSVSRVWNNDRVIYANTSCDVDIINGAYYLANDSRLFNSDEPSLMGKICFIQWIGDIIELYASILKDEPSTTADEVIARYFTSARSQIKDKRLESMADAVYEQFNLSRVPYKELPDCTGKRVLQSILDKYPGKYVYLDFWSTTCGPCISGIKNTFNNRHYIMTRKYDNFVMVFITDDSQSRYEPFRKEWLEGAESYRISTDDYNALSGLFNFTAIPHHELITPDGRALTRVPEMLEVDPNNPDPNQK